MRLLEYYTPLTYGQTFASSVTQRIEFDPYQGRRAQIHHSVNVISSLRGNSGVCFSDLEIYTQQLRRRRVATTNHLSTRQTNWVPYASKKERRR